MACVRDGADGGAPGRGPPPPPPPPPISTMQKAVDAAKQASAEFLDHAKKGDFPMGGHTGTMGHVRPKEMPEELWVYFVWVNELSKLYRIIHQVMVTADAEIPGDAQFKARLTAVDPSGIDWTTIDSINSANSDKTYVQDYHAAFGPLVEWMFKMSALIDNDQLDVVRGDNKALGWDAPQEQGDRLAVIEPRLSGLYREMYDYHRANLLGNLTTEVENRKSMAWPTHYDVRVIEPVVDSIDKVFELTDAAGYPNITSEQELFQMALDVPRRWTFLVHNTTHKLWESLEIPTTILDEWTKLTNLNSHFNLREYDAIEKDVERARDMVKPALASALSDPTDPIGALSVAFDTAIVSVWKNIKSSLVTLRDHLYTQAKDYIHRPPAAVLLDMTPIGDVADGVLAEIDTWIQKLLAETKTAIDGVGDGESMDADVVSGLVSLSKLIKKPAIGPGTTRIVDRLKEITLNQVLVGIDNQSLVSKIKTALAKVDHYPTIGNIGEVVYADSIQELEDQLNTVNRDLVLQQLPPAVQAAYTAKKAAQHLAGDKVKSTFNDYITYLKNQYSVEIDKDVKTAVKPATKHPVVKYDVPAERKKVKVAYTAYTTAFDDRKKYVADRSGEPYFKKLSDMSAEDSKTRVDIDAYNSILNWMSQSGNRKLKLNVVSAFIVGEIGTILRAGHTIIDVQNKINLDAIKTKGDIASAMAALNKPRAQLLIGGELAKFPDVEKKFRQILADIDAQKAKRPLLTGLVDHEVDVLNKKVGPIIKDAKLLYTNADKGDRSIREKLEEKSKEIDAVEAAKEKERKDREAAKAIAAENHAKMVRVLKKLEKDIIKLTNEATAITAKADDIIGMSAKELDQAGVDGYLNQYPALKAELEKKSEELHELTQVPGLSMDAAHVGMDAPLAKLQTMANSEVKRIDTAVVNFDKRVVAEKVRRGGLVASAPASPASASAPKSPPKTVRKARALPKSPPDTVRKPAQQGRKRALPTIPGSPASPAAAAAAPGDPLLVDGDNLSTYFDGDKVVNLDKDIMARLGYDEKGVFSAGPIRDKMLGLVTGAMGGSTLKEWESIEADDSGNVVAKVVSVPSADVKVGSTTVCRTPFMWVCMIKHGDVRCVEVTMFQAHQDDPKPIQEESEPYRKVYEAIANASTPDHMNTHTLMMVDEVDDQSEKGKKEKWPFAWIKDPRNNVERAVIYKKVDPTGIRKNRFVDAHKIAAFYMHRPDTSNWTMSYDEIFFRWILGKSIEGQVEIQPIQRMFGSEPFGTTPSDRGSLYKRVTTAQNKFKSIKQPTKQQTQEHITEMNQLIEAGIEKFADEDNRTFRDTINHLGGLVSEYVNHTKGAVAPGVFVLGNSINGDFGGNPRIPNKRLISRMFMYGAAVMQPLLRASGASDTDVDLYVDSTWFDAKNGYTYRDIFGTEWRPQLMIDWATLSVPPTKLSLIGEMYQRAMGVKFAVVRDSYTMPYKPEKLKASKFWTWFNTTFTSNFSFETIYVRNPGSFIYAFTGAVHNTVKENQTLAGEAFDKNTVDLKLDFNLIQMGVRYLFENLFGSSAYAALQGGEPERGTLVNRVILLRREITTKTHKDHPKLVTLVAQWNTICGLAKKDQTKYHHVDVIDLVEATINLIGTYNQSIEGDGKDAALIESLCPAIPATRQQMSSSTTFYGYFSARRDGEVAVRHRGADASFRIRGKGAESIETSVRLTCATRD